MMIKTTQMKEFAAENIHGIWQKVNVIIKESLQIQASKWVRKY